MHLFIADVTYQIEGLEKVTSHCDSEKQRGDNSLSTALSRQFLTYSVQLGALNVFQH